MPLVMVVLPASLSARSLPFNPACPDQYTNRSFRRWMSTIDTFQSGLPFHFFYFCSKLICMSLAKCLSPCRGFHPNSKRWFTTSFLQPLPYLVTPWGPENCQLTSSFFVGAQIVVSLLQTTQIKPGVSFIAANKVCTSTNKITIV